MAKLLNSLISRLYLKRDTPFFKAFFAKYFIQESFADWIIQSHLQQGVFQRFILENYEMIKSVTLIICRSKPICVLIELLHSLQRCKLWFRP